MNRLFSFLSIFVLLGMSSYFGYESKEVEMGLSIVAGALGLAFSNLDKFSEFKGAGFSAKLNKRIETIENEIEPIKSKETEPDSFELSHPVKREDEENSLKVLDALIDGKYSWRTMTGLIKDTKMSESELSEILTGLESENNVTASKSSAGKTIWGATRRGSIYRQVVGNVNA